MRKATILCAFLLIGGVALATSPGKSSQSNDDFKAFFEKFRAAVIKSDKEAIEGFSRFPIRMPGRVPNIKDVADLRVLATLERPGIG